MNAPSPNEPMEVDCQSVQSKLANDTDFLLLDCRETDEHALVNLPQAELLPMSEIQQRVTELEAYKEREIVVYCHHGGRSLQVTAWLRQLGFTNVTSMAGGIDHWAVAIDPTMRRY